MPSPIRASCVDLDGRVSGLSTLEQALRTLPGYQVTSWRADELEGRLDICAGSADVLVLVEAGQEGERALAAMHGLRDRYASLVIIAAIRAPTCAATLALLDAGADEIVDTTGEEALTTARIAAATRRRMRLGTPVLSEVGNLKFDRTNHRVWNDDRQLRLSPLEYSFLDCLVSARGRSVGTRTLSDFVWTSNGRQPRSKNAVQVYVGYLRRKLAIAQVTIQNIRGKGYRLVDENAPPTHTPSAS